MKYNIINEWERKAKRAMRRNHIGEGWQKDCYDKAMAYCDCISNFTDDESKFDCYDRLMQEMLAALDQADQEGFAPATI